MKTYYIYIILVVTFLSSCSERMNIELGSASKKIIVYGAITTDTVAHRIRITQSADYFSNKPLQTISGAVLTITDGVNLFPLTESPDEPGNYYTQPDVYGESDKTYTLNIDNVSIVGEDQVYSLSAECTMPYVPADYQTKYLDSINVSFNTQWEGWYVNGWANEPEDQKNFYMFKVYINDVLYSDSLNNIIISDDKLINGNSTNGAALYFIQEPDTLKTGYKVTLELSVITEDYYRFLYEVQTSAQPQIPIFSAPPANARTNLNNGAIGFFSAYAIIRSSYFVTQSDIEKKNKLIGKKGGN